MATIAGEPHVFRRGFLVPVLADMVGDYDRHEQRRRVVRSIETTYRNAMAGPSPFGDDGSAGSFAAA